MSTAAVEPRLQPHDEEAECALLGGLLLDGSGLAEVRAILEQGDFYSSNRGAIFRAMLTLAARGEPLDNVTVSAELESCGDLQLVGGRAVIADLLLATPSAANVVAHARLIREHAERRRIIQLAAKLSDAGYRGASLVEIEKLVTVARTPLTSTGANGTKPALHLTPLRTLLNEPDEHTPFLVDGRLPSAGTSALVAKPKAGKSTMARNLALCVARGIPWLGFPTAQGTVFYLALEEKRAEVRRHFMLMGATDDDPVLILCAPSPVDGLILLRESAERERPALIIVDPLLKMVKVKDANDYAAVTAALEPVVTLARDTNAHVLTVHHLGKGERDGGDAILGSTAIFAAVDTALILKRAEKYRTLSTIQRYGEDLEEITLNFDPDSRIVSAGVPRQEADEAAAGSTILDFLKAQSDPLEEPAIHDAVEGRKAVKLRALRRLVVAGKVTRSGEGKRGNPYRYSISGFLVPTICREPEDQKPKNELTPQQSEGYSGSRPFEGSGPGAESWEPESER